MGEVKMRIFSGFAILAYAAAAIIAPAANAPAAKPAAKGIVETEVDKVMVKYPQHAGMAEMLTNLFKTVVSADTIKDLEKEAKKKAWAAKAAARKQAMDAKKAKIGNMIGTLKKKKFQGKKKLGEKGPASPSKSPNSVTGNPAGPPKIGPKDGQPQKKTPDLKRSHPGEVARRADGVKSP